MGSIHRLWERYWQTPRTDEMIGGHLGTSNVLELRLDTDRATIGAVSGITESGK
jgi:hypothetical protein